MTTRDLFLWLDGHTWLLAVCLLLPPLLAFVLRLSIPRQRSESSYWRYIYSGLIYATTVPGILSMVVTGYIFFFTRESLLDVNLVTYVLPIVAMLVTLQVIARSVSLERIPGFRRLSGLMVLLAVSFVIVLIISKMRVWLVFGGSIFLFIILAVLVFGVLRWSTERVFRR